MMKAEAEHGEIPQMMKAEAEHGHHGQNESLAYP
tara:strand:- start:211 stop:312 length:102 start_codon:yes stop_codon:yes gene_type:complete